MPVPMCFQGDQFGMFSLVLIKHSSTTVFSRFADPPSIL